MFDRAFKKLTGSMALLALFVLAQPGIAADSNHQLTFKSPETAVQTLLIALEDNDINTLLAIFGREHEKELIGTDQTAAQIARTRTYEAAKEMHALRQDGDDMRILVIGQEAWPFPIPLVKDSGQWRFDTDAGIEEIINRRVGRNELNAINVCEVYIDAQRLYASKDRDNDEVREYAQRLASTKGTQDGLYWESNSDDDELSPFGPFVAGAQDYMEDRKPSDPFMGYHFRILTRQGPNPPGGEYDYIINGNMIGGFALLAYPAKWGHEGIMTFVCSHQGKIFEKDLAADTLETAKAIQAFDPDNSWQDVGK